MSRGPDRDLVEDFLYTEADLLDERCFDDWLKLMSPDIRYTMPVRSVRLRRPSAGRAGWPVENELSAPHELQLFDETIHTLRIRVERLYTGKAWAEEPPSRTRRVVSNIRVTSADTDHIQASSNFLYFQSRPSSGDDTVYAGRRDDRFTRVDGGLRLASRRILLDNVMLSTGNLSIFF